jgi:hypothetical protein
MEEEQDVEDSDDPFGIIASAMPQLRLVASLPLHNRGVGGLVFNDPHHWWNEMQGELPISQATAAPSERIFIIASKIISNC